jgi:hypothetical protein
VSDATAIAGGGLFSLALLSDGKVVAWGDNSFGQLGDSSTVTQQNVVQVKDLTHVTAIAAGGPDSLAVVSSPAANQSGLRKDANPQTTPWLVVPSQDPSSKVTDLPLDAVSASSATDAWAVGSFPDVTTEPTGEHWDGEAWTFATFAAGPGTPSSLSGVDDLSPTDAWVVGSSASRTLIEHWDGTSWTVVPSPDPETGPGAFDELDAVSGTNPDDIWAVGTFSDGNFAALLFLHWNGTLWTFFAPPSESGIQFGTGVTVVSSDDAWAVGDQGGSGTVSAHFNGKRWSMVSTPILQVKDADNELTGVTNVGADDIWASGYEDEDDINFRTPYVLHWTGAAWTLVKVPNVGAEGSLVEGVTALSASDVWAAGATFQSDGGELTLSERFNGRTWSIVPSLDPGQLASLPNSTFEGIAATGTTTLFTVGSQEIPGRCCALPLAEENNMAG